jgi:hypothetical protein
MGDVAPLWLEVVYGVGKNPTLSSSRSLEVNMHKESIEKIIAFSEEFFGSNKSRTYIKHDFRRVIEGIVQREVLIRIAIECSKVRHNKKEITNKKGEIVSIAYGDYDQDNAGFLYPIIKNQELGLMIDLRLLLSKKEKGAGGKFIKDLSSLKTDDFIKYYKFSKDNGATIIPHLLTADFIANRKAKSGETGNDFIDNHSHKIEQAVNELITKAKKFNDKNYPKQLIEGYEALKFHKDRQPEKYEITENKEGLGGFTFTTTTRHDKSKIDSKKITEALNEFSEVVGIYQLLIDKTDFYGTNWPLDTYMERTLHYLQKKFRKIFAKVQLVIS